LTFKSTTRDELDQLIKDFNSFKERFDRGLAVQAGHALVDLQTKVAFLSDNAGKRIASFM
jgi:hypothetical protein